MIEDPPRPFKEAFRSALAFHRTPREYVAGPESNFGRRLLLALSWDLRTSDAARWTGAHAAEPGVNSRRISRFTRLKLKLRHGRRNTRLPISISLVFSVALFGSIISILPLTFLEGHRYVLPIAVAFSALLHLILVAWQDSSYRVRRSTGSEGMSLDRTMRTEMLVNALELAIGDLYRLAQESSKLRYLELAARAEETMIPSDRIVEETGSTATPEALGLHLSVLKIQKYVMSGSSLEDPDLTHAINVSLIQLENLRISIERQYGRWNKRTTTKLLKEKWNTTSQG